MDIKDIIRDEFDAEVTRFLTNLKKPQLIPFILKHERRHILETNLRQQIFAGELKYGNIFNRDWVKKVVQAGTHIFIHAAVETHVLNNSSAAEVRRREDFNNRENAAAEWYAQDHKEAITAKCGGSLYSPPKKDETGSGQP